MKKGLSLLLAAIMSISILASCSKEENMPDTSEVSEESAYSQSESVSEEISIISEESKAVSEEPSEEASEESSEEASEYTDTEIFGALGKPNRVNVSVGKKYFLSHSPASQYPDSGNELTDGNKAVSNYFYSNEVYCGISSKSFSVTIDLNTDGKNISAFVLSFLSLTDAGLAPPTAVSIDSSDNNKSWQSVGDCIIEPHEEGTGKKAYLNLDKYINARYIRFNISGKSAWIFIDEAEVIACVPLEETEKGKATMQHYIDHAITEEYRESQNKKIASEKALSGNKGILISANMKPKIASAGFDTRLENNIQLLTNNANTLSAPSDPNWVGFAADEGVTFTFDLAYERDDLYAFAVYCLNYSAENVSLPKYVDVFVGSKESEMYFVSSVIMPFETTVNGQYRIVLDRCVKGRYVKFVLPAEAETFYRIEEIEIYADSEDNEKGYYGSFEIEKTEESLWSNTDADNKKTQNLALNKKLMMKSGIDVSAFAQYNPTDIKLLVDGKTSPSNECYNGYWLRCYSGNNRTVVIDLEHTSSVSNLKTNFISRKSWGVQCPSLISFYVSENGENWYKIKEFESIHDDTVERTVNVSVTLDKPCKARYVKLVFDVSSQVFIDEITVNGCKDISGAFSAKALGFEEEGVEQTQSKGYQMPSKDILGGVNDVMLAYHNINGGLNEDHFMPYVGYIDKDGNITDTMFDGFLFLPGVKKLPSGEIPDGGKTLKCDWDSVFESLFTKDRNIDALNKAVGKVKKQLGIKDYKVKVYVSIINVHPEVKDFGDVDNDGISENLTKASDRKKIVQWYIDRITKQMANNRYENVELCGYYWFSEQCSGVYEGVVKETADVVHANNHQFFWIPWFTASGYNKGYRFGFDAICMQPNYAFNSNIPEKRLVDNAMLTRDNGLCYEMETSGAIMSNMLYLRKYMNYMKHGVIEGYSKAINMYYQDVSVFYSCCYSDKPACRLVYDYQYLYMNDKLEVNPEKPDNLRFTASVNTPFVSTLATKESSVTEYKMVTSPSHGSLAVNEDGSFTYYPDKDFIGSDTFTYSINHFLCDSEPSTVTITIQ